MSCTQEQYEELLEAQRKIATGTNVVSVRIDGETTEFGPGNVALLATLISGCEKELGLSDDDNGYFTLSTSKGFV